MAYSTPFPIPQLYCAINAKKSLQFPWYNCQRKTSWPNELIQTFIKWHLHLYKKADNLAIGSRISVTLLADFQGVTATERHQHDTLVTPWVSNQKATSKDKPPSISKESFDSICVSQILSGCGKQNPNLFSDNRGRCRKAFVCIHIQGLTFLAESD